MNEDIFHLGIKGLIKNSKGEYLLLKVNTANLKLFKGEAYWDIPGGRMSVGSNVEETLKREIEEETGVTEVSNIQPFLMVMSNGIRIPLGNGVTAGLILSVFTCEIDENANIQISEEHTEYAWFEPKKASELLQTKYPVELTQKVLQS